MRRILLIVILLFGTTQLSDLFAQNKQSGVVTLYGRVESSKVLLKEYKISVVKNNELIEELVIDSRNGYRLDMDLDGVYLISFDKSGYLSKSIILNGELDSNISVNRTTFQMDINLLGVSEFVDDNFCLLPVAKVYFDEKDNKFTYDKAYTKEMQKLFDKIQEKSKLNVSN